LATTLAIQSGFVRASGHGHIEENMTLNLFSLEGRTALVTGGNGGLGLAMAQGLKEAGARVAVTGRNLKKNTAVSRTLHAPDIVYAMDVYDEVSVERTIAEVVERFGELHILINNAGIGKRSVVTDLSLEEWEATVHVNLTGAFLCSKHAVRAMKATGKGGKVINIGSLYSLAGVPNSVAYGTTKHGIVGLTRAMAVELGVHNIQVNAILPGWCETEMTQHLKTSPVFDFVRRKTPAGRWGNPRDMVGAAVFLASAGSAFVTGAALPVDGGYSVTDRFLYD
jgi:2-deoxy-D-gluconate 3-dehydrogenase